MSFKQVLRRARSVSLRKAAVLLGLAFLSSMKAHGDNAKPQQFDAETVTLAAEYRQLRSGAASPKRRDELLGALGRVFRSGRYSKEDAIGLLGPPDNVE